MEGFKNQILFNLLEFNSLSLPCNTTNSKTQSYPEGQSSALQSKNSSYGSSPSLYDNKSRLKQVNPETKKDSMHLKYAGI
jgi:hypothetical protein